MLFQNIKSFGLIANQAQGKISRHGVTSQIPVTFNPQRALWNF